MAQVVISVVNLKGGTAKTTTAAFFAHALHEAGLSVLVVDADEQASALEWASAAEWPMPTVGLPVRTLHTQLPGIVGSHDVVVIDTPPLETHAGIVASAMRAATIVVIPTAPTPIEIVRLEKVRRALEDVAPLRPDGAPPPAVVLLNRTVSNAASTGVWRESCRADGWHVLNTHIARLELISQAFPDPIVAASTSPYGYAVSEVIDLISPGTVTPATSWQSSDDDEGEPVDVRTNFSISVPTADGVVP